MKARVEAEGDVADKTRQFNAMDHVVSDVLKARRKELGLSQKMLSDAIAVSPPALQKYEGHVARISAGSLYYAALKLDLPIARFFGETSSADGASQGFAETGQSLWAEAESPASRKVGEDEMAFVRAQLERVADPRRRADLLKHIEMVAAIYANSDE